MAPSDQERGVRETLELLERTFESIEEAVFVVRNRSVLTCNQAAERMFGHDRSEMIGSSTRMLHVDEEHFRRFDRISRPELEQGGVFRTRFEMCREGGEIFATDHTVTVLDPMEGIEGGVVSVIRDVTELEAMADQRELYYRHIQSAREEERRRTAMDLHDDLGQTMALMRMELDRLERATDSPEELDARVEAVKSIADEAIETVRRIANELRPHVLDELGLVPAVEWLCDDFRDRWQIDCTFESELEQLPVDSEAEGHVFRIVQEALTNVGRHSEASLVMVRIERLDGISRIEVEDDGKGFDPDRPPRAGAMGLVGMKERTALLDGDLSVESTEDGGTRVSIEFPLDVEGEDDGAEGG